MLTCSPRWQQVYGSAYTSFHACGGHESLVRLTCLHRPTFPCRTSSAQTSGGVEASPYASARGALASPPRHGPSVTMHARQQVAVVVPTTCYPCRQLVDGEHAPDMRCCATLIIATSLPMLACSPRWRHVYGRAYTRASMCIGWWWPRVVG